MIKTKMVPGEWGALPVESPRSAEQIESKAREFLSQMTLEEKISQMSGDVPFFPGVLGMMRAYNTEPIPAGENLRLGIPGIRFSDGPRGVVMDHSTCFPVSMGRGATWDVNLEERVGDVVGIETRAQGGNFFAGVCINLLRHPAWGRAQETYGEDPYLLGEMGAALVRGVQQHVMACVKHYALNSIENARFSVDVKAGERVLREVYLPHFKRCVDEGAASVMSAYNQVNGSFCGHSRHLLTEILKDEWGFKGFVVSDFVFGVRDAKAAALAGLDIEMPFKYYYQRHLKKLVKTGDVPESILDDAVLRILRQKLRFAQVGKPANYPHSAVANKFHCALAREVAAKSMVLLKNDHLPSGGRLLPIDLSQTGRLAIIGSLAAAANIGDHGSSMVRPPYVVTPLEGIRGAVGESTEVMYESGQAVELAVQAARQADAVIVVAGYTFKDEGEYMIYIKAGGDRRSLTLNPRDEGLIQAVAAANPRTVVVMIGGSAIITEAWRERIPAILMAWYPGMEGGHALADILFGKVNPGGKLPCVFPKSEKQLPFFDPHAKTIEYDLYHGYRLMEKQGEEPAFAFGFGLSYTTFACRHLIVEPRQVHPEDIVLARVEVTNIGSCAGDEVVQLYVGALRSKIDRPVKELKGFRRVHLEPGESKTVDFKLPVQQLAYYEESEGGWKVEPAIYGVHAGSSSRMQDLQHGSFEVI